MHHDPLPDDLLGVAQTLERHRPTLEGLELDELKRRTMRASRTTTTTQKGSFMRTRLAITTMLCSGLLLSSGGTAIGVSALRQTSDASVAQYGKPDKDKPQTLGETASGGDEGSSSDTDVAADTAGGSGPTVAGESAGGGDGVQAARQVGTVAGDSLPFTGYAAIPVLLMGLALLASGLVLRRRAAG